MTTTVPRIVLTHLVPLHVATTPTPTAYVKGERCRFVHLTLTLAMPSMARGDDDDGIVHER